MKMAFNRTDLVPAKIKKSLDSLLKHFELEERDPNEKHDAYLDY